MRKEQLKEYLVNVCQYGFAIVEATSAEEAQEKIESDSSGICWNSNTDILEVEEHE